MRILISPAGRAPLELVVDAELEIGQVKEIIEGELRDDNWRATTMSLYDGNMELTNNSTLRESNIAEFATLSALTWAQGTSFPTGDTEMFSNNGDGYSVGNTEFFLNELMDLPATPIEVKMILPHNFQATAVLNYTATHHFQSAGQLRDKIDHDQPAWLSKLEAYAIISNVHIFLAEFVQDFYSRRDGGVALVMTSHYEDIHQGRGYKSSTDTTTVEKSAGKFKISGEITLDRFEIVGDLWTRRRIHTTGDSTYSLIQWLSTKPKKKDTVKEEVSNAVKAVGELKLTLDTVATDVTGIKQDVCSIQQNLTDVRTTLAAILDRFSQQPPLNP